MERVVIHCHCKEAIEGIRKDLKEIKELLSPKSDNSLNSLIMDTEGESTSKVESETEQVDEEIKKALCTPDFKSKIQTLVEKAFDGEGSHAQPPTMVGQSPSTQSQTTQSPSTVKKPKYDWGKNPRGALFIQQYVADNEGSKSNRVRDMTFRLGLEIGLWTQEDKKAVNYKIEQTARSYKKKEANPPQDSD